MVIIDLSTLKFHSIIAISDNLATLLGIQYLPTPTECL